MNKQKRLVLVSLVAVLILSNGLFWFYNFGLRVKGTEYHTSQAADGVVEKLVSRDLISSSLIEDEPRIYFDVFMAPIRPHIDPYQSAAIFPPLFNSGALVLILIFLLLPERKIVDPSD